MSSPPPCFVECSVCHQVLAKCRVHYGGVTCYSCRAFFRRNTQKQDRLGCQNSGKCVVTHKERKACTDCRYVKCIRMGMLPKLVLNAEEKKERFKKCLAKNKRDLISDCQQIDTNDNTNEANSTTQSIEGEERKSFILLESKPAASSHIEQKPIASPIYILETHRLETIKLESSDKQIQSNKNRRNCGINTLTLTQICKLPLSLDVTVKQEIKKEEVDSEVTLAQDDKWSNKIQLIRKDFEAIKYFSQDRNLQRKITSTGHLYDKEISPKESEKRKSVIIHTSEANTFC
eukprot:GFUD01022418.1.p1 GENE.GFUD01022418.1~~GFUD01022418.1.p1  ORF type:complete len:289 (-),score=76.83 GFUD01022418.1:205-1071(-)